MASTSNNNDEDVRAPPECTDRDIEQGGGGGGNGGGGGGGIPLLPYYNPPTTSVPTGINEHCNTNNDRDDGPPLPLPLQNLDLENDRDIAMASSSAVTAAAGGVISVSPSEAGDTKEDKSPTVTDLEEIGSYDEDAPVPLVQLVAEMEIDDTAEETVGGDTPEDKAPPMIDLVEISAYDEDAPVPLVQMVAGMEIDDMVGEISSRDVLSKASINARCTLAQPPQDEENIQQSENDGTQQVSSAAEERESSSLPLIPLAFLVEESSDGSHVYDAIAIPLEPELPWWKHSRAKLFVAIICALIAALAISLGVTLSRPAPTAVVTANLPPPSIRISLSPSQSPSTWPTGEPVSSAPYSATSCEPYRGTVNFGYYESWAAYRYGDSGSCNPLQPNAIKVADFGYAHLSFSFAGISQNGLIEPYDGESAEFIPMYKAFNSHKASNPGLKTMISVGGWTFDQTRFSFAASTPTTRSNFSQSVVSFLTDHDFDGIDLDWEHPVTRQGTPEDYDNYPLLCQALREAFDDAGHPEWHITIQIPISWNDRLVPGYDLVGLAPYLDWFNVMAYDIFGAWDSYAGANTDMTFIKDTIANIFALGIPREKIVRKSHSAVLVLALRSHSSTHHTLLS